MVGLRAKIYRVDPKISSKVDIETCGLKIFKNLKLFKATCFLNYRNWSYPNHCTGSCINLINRETSLFSSQFFRLIKWNSWENARGFWVPHLARHWALEGILLLCSIFTTVRDLLPWLLILALTAWTFITEVP